MKKIRSGVSGFLEKELKIEKGTIPFSCFSTFIEKLFKRKLKDREKLFLKTKFSSEGERIKVITLFS